MNEAHRRALFALLFVSIVVSASTGWSDPNVKDVALDPGLAVQIVGKSGWDKSTPEKSYFGVYSANKAGDAAWIIDTFAPAERDGVTKLTSDQQLLAANTEIFKNNVQETIRRKIEYSGVVILVVEALRSDGRISLRNIPFKKVGTDWLVTNELSSDKYFLALKSGYIDR
jgi:hypothetical protein